MAKHETLAAALAAFQAVVPKMSKDETAKVKSEKANYTYGYAGLDQFVEIVEPVLGQHGMSITSRTTFTDSVFMLEVSLVHEGGERETAYWPLPDPRRAGPQDLGSAMTYGRRYLGWGLTGTFPGGIDDDGAKAQTTARDSWEDAKPRPPAQQAAPTPADPPKVKKEWTNDEVRDQHAKLMGLDVDKAVTLYDWMAGKGLHDRRIDDVTATQLMATRISDEALDILNTTGGIEKLRTIAEARGLLKIQVSDTETLDQVLFEAHELARHAQEAEASQDGPVGVADAAVIGQSAVPDGS